MTIRITCSQCARKYKFKDEAAGKKSKCHCGAVIRIPKKSESPAPAVVEQEQLEVSKPETADVPPPMPKLPDAMPNHIQSPDGYKNCKKCGKQSTKGSRFCQWCGAPLSSLIINPKNFSRPQSILIAGIFFIVCLITISLVPSGPNSTTFIGKWGMVISSAIVAISFSIRALI